MNTAHASLPIDKVIPQLCDAMSANRNCLLVAQPGAGKTTRVPLAIIEDEKLGSGRWLLLEPRRVAARLAANYMAAQIGEDVGKRVGYRVRGESKISALTRLEVITQGILTRMLQDDPSLEGVSGIIFDEFHERSLDADLGLALCLDVQGALRDDLRLLVMSATLDVKSLLAVLGEETPLVECPGRTFPIETLYRNAPARERAENHQCKIVSEALSSHEGDILCFLPGQAEIRRLQRVLEERLSTDIDICPLHGQLTLAQQQEVLRPSPQGRRRIILSTAIAESSLTVPGVRIVIDGGLERVPIFQVRSGLAKLETRSVNAASADQRRGRAGRVAPGVCYRLWPQDRVLASHREAEILQADLASLVFEVVRWGISSPRSEIAQLQWVDTPPPSAINSAVSLLESLDLLTNEGGLSELGKQCQRWPTQPRLALLLQHSIELACPALGCWLTAWFEESIGGSSCDIEAIFESRHSMAARLLKRWERSSKQWAGRLNCTLDIKSLTPMPVLLARAFPDRIAQKQGGDKDKSLMRFKLASGGQAIISSQQTLSQSDYLVAVELDGDAAGARIFQGIAISKKQLESCLDNASQWNPHIYWDNNSGRLVGEEQRRIGALILDSRPMQSLPPEAVKTALLDALRSRASFKWSKEDAQLIGRLRLLRRIVGEPWPDVSDEALLASMEDWLGPRLESITRLDQVDRLPLAQFFKESLDWSLQSQLSSIVPTHLEVPSGSHIAIDYREQEPVLAVKLQEMFGMTETPRIVDGKVPLLIHLLSPARRPLQITRDLAGFWAGSYFEVRKEMKGRYPKHPWPEDPSSAVATAKTRRHLSQ